MKRHPSRVIVAALALSLLAACSADSTDKPTASSGGTSAGSATSASGPGATASGGATSDPSQNGASDLGVEQPDPSKVLISKQFDVPGKPERKVTVGILSLERKDQVAILKVIVTPEFTDLPADETIPFTKALNQFGSHFMPTLLDLKNLKKYKVLYSGGQWLNGASGEAVSGQPIFGWAAFAPPPAGVNSVDLTITDWMPRFTNVPVR